MRTAISESQSDRKSPVVPRPSKTTTPTNTTADDSEEQADILKKLDHPQPGMLKGRKIGMCIHFIGGSSIGAQGARVPPPPLESHTYKLYYNLPLYFSYIVS